MGIVPGVAKDETPRLSVELKDGLFDKIFPDDGLKETVTSVGGFGTERLTFPVPDI